MARGLTRRCTHRVPHCSSTTASTMSSSSTLRARFSPEGGAPWWGWWDDLALANSLFARGAARRIRGRRSVRRRFRRDLSKCGAAAQLRGREVVAGRRRRGIGASSVPDGFLHAQRRAGAGPVNCSGRARAPGRVWFRERASASVGAGPALCRGREMDQDMKFRPRSAVPTLRPSFATSSGQPLASWPISRFNFMPIRHPGRVRRCPRIGRPPLPAIAGVENVEGAPWRIGSTPASIYGRARHSKPIRNGLARAVDFENGWVTTVLSDVGPPVVAAEFVIVDARGEH